LKGLLNLHQHDGSGTQCKEHVIFRVDDMTPSA